MRTELTLAFLFLIGLILKLANINEPGMIFLISLGGLGMVYFPSAVYFFCDKNIEKQNLLFSIFSGLLLSLIPIGILFKLMFWPGPGEYYLITGTIVAPILLIITIVLKSKAAPELTVYYKNMLLRTGILTFISILFLLTSMEMILKIQYRNDPELARLKAQYYTNYENQAYKKEYDEYMLKNYPLDQYIKQLQYDSLPK